MFKHNLLPLLLSILPMLLTAQDNNCSNWYDHVCLSYCSNAGNLTAASGLLCLDAGATSPENPARIPTCFNAPSERTNATPQILLCLPQGLCRASISVYKMNGPKLSLVLNNNNIYLGDNRDTPCDNCEDPNRYLVLHDSYAGLLGTYYVQVSYACCGSEPISFVFYYAIEDAVSSADLTLKYTASSQIETLNGDLVLDGYIPYNGAVPGPELGPYSSGVRLSAVGMGAPNQYTLTLSSISCGSTGTGTPIYSTTLSATNGQAVEFKFHNIPNWSNIYVPGKCYKVTLTGQGICGTVSKTGFFSITQQCISCRPGVDDRTDILSVDQEISLFPNPSNGMFQIAGTFERDFTVQLLHPTGQLLAEYRLPAGSEPVNITVPESVNNKLLLVRISDGIRTVYKKHQVLR